MSGLEVVGCVAAVVSAFHGGAELIQIIRERKEKKRKRKEKEMEQAFQEKMLHGSLVEGARQCEDCRLERARRFGRAFDTGDETARSQLKDVVIHLQGEVIRALQIAREVETAVLNLPRLHEASITDRTDAIRSMDDLCQRIMASLPPPRQLDEPGMSLSRMLSNTPGVFLTALPRASSDSLDSFQTASMTLPAGVIIPGRQDSQQSSFGRMQSARHTSDGLVQRAQSVMAPPVPSPRISISQARRNNDYGRGFLRDPAFAEDALDASDAFSHLSLHDSVRAGSDTTSRHRPSASISSAAESEKLVEAEINAKSPAGPSQVQTDFAMSPLTPSTSTSSTSARHQWEINVDDAGVDRSSSAPEVVTKEFESKLSHRASPTVHSPQLPSPRDIHPAFRDAYIDSPVLVSPEPDEVWTPLQRPARINNYHGFCKGAWQTRDAEQSGLTIAMLRTKTSGEFLVPHWKCKQCEFRSRAMNTSNQLPEQIYFAKSGIRYRWLFLARSHVPAQVAQSKVEYYKYGCIFCAAQGNATATHENLDALMIHIVSRHKTMMLTPEVLKKTKCIVGGVADRSEEWDINLPETKVHSVGSAVGEFVVSAVTGISKYG
jgi:hypothetical protein